MINLTNLKKSVKNAVTHSENDPKKMIYHYLRNNKNEISVFYFLLKKKVNIDRLAGDAPSLARGLRCWSSGYSPSLKCNR